MWVKALKLAGFGKFHQLALSFSPGLNLILGPNEAGKSTLVRAIFGIVFGLSGDNYRPWAGEDSYSGEIVLAENGQEFSIERNFESNKLDYKGEGEQIKGVVSPRGRSSTYQAYLEKLQALLGFNDEELFRRSILINQMELAAWGRPVGDEKKIIMLIKSAISGFESRDYDQVLDELKQDYYFITKSRLLQDPRDMTNDRQLEMVRADLKALRERHRQAEVSAGLLVTLSDKVDRLRFDLVDAKSNSKKTQQLLKEVREFKALEEKEERLKGDYSRLIKEKEKREKLENDLAKKEEELRLLAGLEKVPQSAIQGLARYEQDMAELAEKESQIRTIIEQGGGLPSVPSLRFLFAGGFAILVFGLLSFLWPQWRLLFGLAAALSLVTVYVLYARKCSHRQQLKAVLEDRRLQLQKEIDRRKAASYDLANVWTQAGFPSVLTEAARFLKDCERFSKLSDEKKSIQERLAELRSAEELESQLSPILGELGVVGGNKGRMLSALPVLDGYDAKALSELYDREKEWESKVEELEQELEKAKSALLEKQISAESPQSLAEEISVLSAREATLVGRKEAIALGITTLKECIEEYRAGFLERFSKEVGANLYAITGGRYQEIRFDEELSGEIKTPGGKWVEVSCLSQGTQDQLYFAIRLALAQMISGKKELPLILDDPFFNFDDERTVRAMDLLKAIASRHQILLFTHREEYLGMAPEANSIRLE